MRLSLSWWVYLLAAGLGLIIFAAYTELKNRLSRLSVAVADFKQKTAPATPEK